MDARAKRQMPDRVVEDRLWIEEGEKIRVRQIAAETERGLRYRAELGESPNEIACVDARTAEELFEILPSAVQYYAASLRLRRAR